MPTVLIEREETRSTMHRKELVSAHAGYLPSVSLAQASYRLHSYFDFLTVLLWSGCDQTPQKQVFCSQELNSDKKLIELSTCSSLRTSRCLQETRAEVTPWPLSWRQESPQRQVGSKEEDTQEALLKAHWRWDAPPAPGKLQQEKRSDLSLMPAWVTCLGMV